jgi:L-threonylcarbamoyladenylate synthase
MVKPMVKIFEANPKALEIGVIAEAAATIRTGGLVIYPTETVYGLGANACSDETVGKVFEVKARPLENPISIAVSSLGMARRFAELTPLAESISKKFLPGPLTVILPAKPTISKLVTAGTGKVGLRIPNHPVALKLLDFVGGAITSTSANLSGGSIPSTAKGALEQLGKHVNIALDSGKCKFGLPSTVLDLTSEQPKVLREGPISSGEIMKALAKST